MFTTASIKQFCIEQGTELLSIDSVSNEPYPRETKVTVRCCIPDCTEQVSKSAQNLFKNKNLGCKVHSKIFKGQKISETKIKLNLKAAMNNDDGKRYTRDQLCAIKFKQSLFDISFKLKITNYHDMKRNAIIDAVIERQNELDRLRGVEETKTQDSPITFGHTIVDESVDLTNNLKTQDNSMINIVNVISKRQSEVEIFPSIAQKKKPDGSEIVNHRNTTESIDPTKDLKTQLLEKNYFFEYNEQVWTQANLITECLQYKDSVSAIRDLVDQKDKMYFRDFPPHIKRNIRNAGAVVMEVESKSSSNRRLQQNTLFINDNGLTKLIYRSKMPIATGKKRGIEEVYIATTSTYERKGIYKIGKSENSKNRINNMNTSRLPDDEMYLCYVAKCYNALKAEKTIHTLLDTNRVVQYREFFKMDFTEMTKIVDTVCANSFL